MGKFSKIFHHIESKDLRNKHEQKKAAKLQEEKKKKEFKQYLVSTMETKKYNWREAMTTSDVSTINVDKLPGDGTVTAVDTIDASSYITTVTGVFTPGDSYDGNTGSQIRNSGSGSGQDGGFALGQQYLSFQGEGYNETGHAIRWAGLSAIDSTEVDTLEINAIVGNDSNGGEDPDEVGEELYVMYKTPEMNQFRFLIMKPDGSFPPGKDGSSTDDVIIPIGASANSGLNKYSVEIPDFARAKGTEFLLIQLASSGIGFDNYGITEINFQRRTPLTVVVPLDNPEASSFIRSAPPKSTPKKRKKAVDDKLQASDDYTGAKFGNEFPGREVRVGGEDPFRSAKIGDDVEPSPQSRSQVKKAFGATQLKSALGQPDVQKADPQAKVSNIVKSGEVKSQPASEPKINLGNFQSKVEQGKTKSAVNSIVNQNVSPTQKLEGLSTVMSTVAEKNPEQLPTVIDAVVKSGEEATTEKKNRIIIGLENVKNVVSGAADWAGDTINGFGDAFVVLNQMSKAVSNAYKEDNIEGGRIKEGAPGSLSNPINTKVSNSTAQDILKGVDLEDIINKGELTNIRIDQLLSNLEADPISGNLGAKAIHNRLAQSNIDNIRVNENGDLIIPDTYAFRPLGHEDNKITTAYANIVGLLGGDKEEATKDMATILDQSIGAIFNVAQGALKNITNPIGSMIDIATGKSTNTARTGGFVPGRDDPQVEFQTVIPKEQLLEILKRGDKNIPNAEAVIKALENLSSDKKNEILNSMGMNPDADSTLPTNQAPPPGEGKRNSAYYREQPDKVLPGGIVLKWIPGAVTYKQGNPSLGLADPKDWIPGSWTDITEYIPWTNIPASQAKKSGMDVSATTAPGDRNGAQSDATTKSGTPSPETGDGNIPFDTDTNLTGQDPIETSKNLKNIFSTDEIQSAQNLGLSFDEIQQILDNGDESKLNDAIEAEKFGEITDPTNMDWDNEEEVEYYMNKYFQDKGMPQDNTWLLMLLAAHPKTRVAGGILKIIQTVGNWYNKNKIPGPKGEEGWTWKKLLQDDWLKRQISDKTGKWNPFRSLYTWASDKGGFASGPTPLVREFFRRLGPLGTELLEKITDFGFEANIKPEIEGYSSEELLEKMNKAFEENPDEFEVFDSIMEKDPDYAALVQVNKKQEEVFKKYPDAVSSYDVYKAFQEAAIPYYGVNYETDDGSEWVNTNYNKGYSDSMLGKVDALQKEVDGYTSSYGEYARWAKQQDVNKPGKPINDPNFKSVSVDDHYRKTGSGYSTDLTKSPYLQAEIKWLADNTPGFEYETYAKLNKEMVDLRPYKVEKVNFDLEGLDFFKQITDPKNPGKFEELYKEVKEKEARVDDKFVTTDKERYDKAVEARNTYDESVTRLIKYFEKIMDQETQAGDKMRDYVKKARDTRKAEKEKMQKNVDAELDKARAFYDKNVKPIWDDYSSLFDSDKELDELYEKIDFDTLFDNSSREYLLQTEKERIKNNWSNEDEEEDIDLSIEPVSPDPFVDELKAGLGGKDGDLIASAGVNYDLYNWYVKTYGAGAAGWYMNNPSSNPKNNPFLPGGAYVPKASLFKDLGSVASIGGADSATAAATAASTTGRKKKRNTPMVAHFKPRGKNLFERVSKLRKPNEFFNQDDIKPEFPENPPPKLDPKTGKHPEYGKKANRYKKLDPISANSMPPTGDPEIDAVVNKQKTINKIKKMARNK